jgi:cyclophilin family peptidyl-prolyl cis-trans isomerase
LALADSALPVRLRAADLVTTQCASDTAIVPRIWALTRKVPASGARTKGTATWQPFAHAIVALARVAPAEARDIIRTGIGRNAPVGVRMYQARAAEVLGDTVVLRRLADDPNDNVRELAIDGLSRVSKTAANDVYIKGLSSNGYQVVRSAANALKGAQRTPELVSALQSALTRLQSNGAETARDARVAIVARLTEIGEPGASASLAREPAPLPLSPDAVALALGREVRLRVVMADSSGGGSFVVRLRGDNAPIMAARVLELAKSGWYNNRPWYRVEHDFVIQGGGPGANEYVGHPRFMRDELGSVQHVRGTVGMSTRGHDTGDAQWFINLRDNQRLTPQYTLFGEVVDGIDVVDGILEGDVIARIEVVPSR